MDFKNMIFTIGVGLSLLLLYSSCGKEKCTKIYNPILEVNIFNDLDTFNLNDTFLFSCKSDITLPNFNTNEKVNFYQFNFDLLFFLRRYHDTATYETSLDLSNGFNCFEIIDIIGTREKVNNFENRIFHIQTIDSLNFAFKIIPKVKGLYYISIGNHQQTNNHTPKNINITNSDCKEYFNYLCPRFNNGKVNSNLINHVTEFKRPTPFTDLEIFKKQNSIYYFYVK